MNHALSAGLDRGPRIRQRRRSTLLARAGECAACVTAKIAGELYDVMRFRPDFTISAGGESHFGEIKLEATRDFDRPGQAEARRALNGGKEVPPINETSCGCGKK